MQSLSDIRSGFLSYFGHNGHTAVPSSSLVPRNDPTLMFTNAGMVQFKNVFTGQEQRSYTRAASSQKCVRAGGKHNDLENVGYTARHHTFFEMLGNFSFGDYFKETAIELAWTFIIRDLALDQDKLLVTVYAEDEDAAALWRKIAGLSDKRIIRIPTSDNFWSMGETGPCGPCSEIFYDQGPDVAGGPPGSADEDGDRFLEFWNLVFMQFEQVAPGNRVPLPKPSIDTGMGLERITAILQGKKSNYAIDLMRTLIEAIAHATNTDPDGPQAASHRVIADHLRASAFLIADGVMPSNEGRGYVLRRIMRRAMRHAHMLGARDPLLVRLIPTLIAQMGQAYPELIRAQALISETLRLEETRFRQTLERGLRLLDDEVARLGQGQKLPGAVAFKLYDTYGFPLDLTEDVLRGRGSQVDKDGFDAAMKTQREDARRAWKGSGEASTEGLWFELRDKIGATEFLGYDTTEAEGVVTAILKDGAQVTSAEAGAIVQILVNQTPFYAESGGQVGDTGIMRSAGAKLTVLNTEKKLGQLFVHHATVSEGAIKVGDAVELIVDGERRNAIRANHSATHLLHEALRRRLGEHVTQKGSLVAPERLRFDISQPNPLTDADIAVVERDVNRRIRGNSEVVTRLMGIDDAMQQGAMALFGEKYGEEVRVVSMGGREDGANRDYSVELCGGTHVGRTGDIGVFKILSEGAVAAGIRRIEAVTGESALTYFDEQLGWLDTSATALKAQPGEVPQRVASLLEEKKRLERELSETRRKLAVGDSSGGEAREIKGVKFITRTVKDIPPKELKPMADALKQQAGSGVVAIAGENEGKLSLLVGVTADLITRFSAVDLVRLGAEAAGGKGGGGKPDSAQAGGPDAAKAGEAMAAIEKALADV
jgi:alanyl-tRNA synthetase